MPENLCNLAVLSPFPKKLIVVLEQDERIGKQFVQLIQQETPFQGILATRLSEVRNVLAHLKCDVLLLTDETFPEDDLACLSSQSECADLPIRLNIAFLSSIYNYRDSRDMKSIIKAVALLLTIRDSPGYVISPEPLCKPQH